MKVTGLISIVVMLGSVVGPSSKPVDGHTSLSITIMVGGKNIQRAGVPLVL